jgi:polyhydroxyalkanoate synthesis regulator phasin
MAEATFIQEGVGRVQSALKSLDKEYRRIQKQADVRLRKVEKRAERQIKRLQAGLLRSPLAKRAEDVRRRVEEARADAQSMFEGRLEAMLGTLKIATRTEIEKLERKVALLNTKLHELERAKPARRAAVAKPKRRARR